MNNTRIKVLQFIHGFSIGGAETLVKNYCLLFNKNLVDLTVICLMNHHSQYDEELNKAGINVIYIYDIIDKYIKGPKIIKKICHRLFGKLTTKYYINKNSPDIIHYHLILSDYIKFAKPNLNTKIVLTVHHDISDMWGENGKCLADFKSIKWLMSRYSFEFIVLSEEMKIDLLNINNQARTKIVHNGIDVSKLNKLKTKEELKIDYKINKKEVIFGHVGRFSKIKNHDFLIDVYNEINHLIPNSKLWLVGDGELREQIKEKVIRYGLVDKVVFWGTRSDAPNLIKMMDVFIMPSFKEGISITLLESQIVGTKCLVSDSIVKETSISNLLIFKNLECGATKWAEDAVELSNEMIVKEYGNVENWDINEIVKNVENYYLKMD